MVLLNNPILAITVTDINIRLAPISLLDKVRVRFMIYDYCQPHVL
jgi:hypothetical protein